MGNIVGIASLSDADTGDLSFLGNAKYKSDVVSSKASVVLVPKEYELPPGKGIAHFVVENPSASLARLCARVEQGLWPKPSPGIHASAVVGEGVRISASATVGPHCVIENNVVIGDGTHLQAQVFIGAGAVVGDDCRLAPGVHIATQCQLGDRVRLHAGVVIGSDGFGYELVDGRHGKVPQVGDVQLENDVEIGANSTVDRARFGRTRIGEGTKIDNLVQVAHNVVIGRHCILCAQVGISGSTTLEDYVVLGGQAGVAGHLRLGKAAKIGGQAGVTQNLDPGAFVSGNPAIPHMLERRIFILSRRLPDLFRNVSSLAEEIEELKKASDS